ncbi:MAG: hypothetical protein LBQ33_02505, partial [Oscillospiraceae bacterium]|nr:hypothetical protein [Oscillospiraceae bacterium]
MRWNKCAVCAGLLCLLLAAAGCAYKPLFWDINLLMRPPLLQGELGELQSAVLEDNRGYRFAQAVGGKFRDAITLRDLDGDGSEEALMFLLSPYAIDYPEEQMSKTFCVYSKASGKWR